MRRTATVLGFLATIMFTLAQVAPAQQKAPVQTAAVVNHFDVRSDSTSVALGSALFDNLQTLRRYQEQYFAQHGRFAESGSELPEFRPLPGASIFATTGGDWAVVQGQLPGIASYTITLWVKNTPQRIISGSFGEPAVAQAPTPRQ